MKDLFPGTCVAPTGEFVYCIHKPHFTGFNLRETDYLVNLGNTSEQEPIDNAENFPADEVEVAAGEWIFEIPNSFPFMGATFILKSEADRSAGGNNPFKHARTGSVGGSQDLNLEGQSRAALLSLASTSDDPALLAKLAEKSCRFAYDKDSGAVSGIVYGKTDGGDFRPLIFDSHLFQLVSNNQFLPDDYKRFMVLLPGAQGTNPIVGEYTQGDTHIWEYMRDNSYIPWGHYAANMAHDAVRYRIQSLSQADIVGLRHLYYQRIYVQLAGNLGLPLKVERRPLTVEELEGLRLSVRGAIKSRNKSGKDLPFNATMWGQNFGFDLSCSGYRLAASHQQVHQQFALIPSRVLAYGSGNNETSLGTMPAYTQTDLMMQFAREYREKTGRGFFDTYLEAIGNNLRVDGRVDKESDLFFYQDENIIAFVPKAQRSQGEVQIMTKVRCGNILEADVETRASLDRALLLTMKVLENLGVKMFVALEIPKRLDNPDIDQRLLYCFLPRHPQSPGGFSEFQQRWISNQYPEDFARTCRDELQRILKAEP
jgi:hypothetical protein